MNNILSIIQSIRNPQAFIQQAMNNPQCKQNPIMQNAMDLLNKNDIKGLESLANNLAREQGVNLADIRKHFGI